MTEDVLARPVWHSLNGALARFAVGNDEARRFHPDIGPLSAPRAYDEVGLAALARLVPADAPIFTMEAEHQAEPQGIQAERRAAVQMVAEAVVTESADTRMIAPLGPADAQEMLALATLTEPGPFGIRTGELGRFWGVRIDDRLVAMAGERLRPPGFSEVSGVCVHPDFRGQGYAQALMLRVMGQIRARGETPFLTSYAHNSGAIALYEKIGFRKRRDLTITVLTRAPAVDTVT